MSDPLDGLLATMNENIMVLKVMKNITASNTMEALEKADLQSKAEVAKAVLTTQKSEHDLIMLVNTAFKQYLESLDLLNGLALETKTKNEDKKPKNVKFFDESQDEPAVKNVAMERDCVPTPPPPSNVLRMPESPILQSSFANMSILKSTRKYGALQMPRTPETLRKSPNRVEKYQMRPKVLNFDESSVNSSILK